MASLPRLASLHQITEPVTRPAYNLAEHGVGIVHLGVGAFHRAHVADYCDQALAKSGGDWRIQGVSLRSTTVADQLNPQNGLYTLLVRDAAGLQGRVIGAIQSVLTAAREKADVLKAMTNPEIRIVTITVTEKAYGISRETGGVDMAHPAVIADLAAPEAPGGVLGLLTEALRQRRAAGTPPFTVLCCDNLPANGTLLRQGVTSFAGHVDPDLAAWIEGNVAFPCSMVDRITPASTETTLQDAARLTGCADHAAVETEPFSQWVIEDTFPQGRPALEEVGAELVGDVAPFEQMKLRMLNGSHSMMAYAGFLSGKTFIRDVMADEALQALVGQHMRAASKTLPPGLDTEAYASALMARFANPAIAHETYQIAMDGTQKLPQRLLAPAHETLRANADIGPFAFAVAAWMRYCLGRRDDGEAYALRDPRESEIATIVSGKSTASDIADALHDLPGLFPAALTASPVWRDAVTTALARMLEEGMSAAISAQARASSG